MKNKEWEVVVVMAVEVMVSLHSGNQESGKNYKVPVNPKIIAQHIRRNYSVWTAFLPFCLCSVPGGY